MVLSNFIGSVTSVVAMLTVHDPAFTAQPADRQVQFGQTASFTADVVGTPPLAYQWVKDGIPLEDSTNIEGSTSPTLTISNAFGGNRGNYGVMVSNVFGSVTSAVALLKVVEPIINVQPESQNRELGQNVSFDLVVLGSNPLNYQWSKDGLLLAEATNATLNLTNLKSSDGGRYRAVVNNSYGSVTSAVVFLTINVPAALDAQFRPQPDATVYSLAVQTDGQVLVGGTFTNIAGYARNRIARLHRDGTLDTGFDPGADSAVQSLVVQTDGKIIAAGNFTNLAGQPRNRIARLNADGSLDLSFDPDANDIVWCAIPQEDGKILLGGNFTMVGGLPRSRIARLHANGTLDLGFNPDAQSSVSSLAVQPDGKILVGGTFLSLAGQQRRRLGRLNEDGSLDADFAPAVNPPTVPTVVASIALEATGGLLVAGSFTNLAGGSRNRIGRLNADGSLDATFNPNADSTVLTLAIQADGKILVGGGFTNLAGQPRDRIARLNPDGSLDTGFNPSADAAVFSLCLQTDGKILVGGGFSSIAGQPNARLARLDATSPAGQKLSYDGSIITWSRSGTLPEVLQVKFEVSTNGNDWVELDGAARVFGGWELAGIAVPAGGLLRARGHVTGGFGNASTWIIESLLPLYPLILTRDTYFGFAGGRFGFNIQAIQSQTGVIEASTNLLGWVALQTNTFGMDPLYFSDLDSSNFAWRFYRVRLVP